MGKLKYPILTIALMLLITLMVACNNSSEPSGINTADSDNSSTQSEGGSDSSERPEVVIYSNVGGSEEGFDRVYGNVLREKFPQYDIKYIPSGEGKRIADLITAGTRFDILFENTVNYLSHMENYGIGYDMTDLLKKHEVDLSAIEPAMLDALRESTDGKVHALPVYNNSLIMFYNKSVFDRFGVPYPTDGMTWTETMELSRQLTRQDSDGTFYGFAQVPSHTFRLNPLGVPVADIENHIPTINTDDRWKRLIETIFISPAQSPEYEEFMLANQSAPGYQPFYEEQNVGMLMYLAGLARTLARTENLDWDMVALPTFEDYPNVGSQASPVFYGVTQMAKDKDAAMDVLKHLVSEEFQMYLAKRGTMPVLRSDAVKDAYGQDTDYSDKNLGALFYNQYAPTPPKAVYDATLTNLYASYATKVQLGEMDMNSALRQAEEEAKRIIEETLK